MNIAGYRYSGPEASHTVSYLFGSVLATLESRASMGAPRRVFELGCGNGAVARLLTDKGYQVVGVDPSTDGIKQARAAQPDLSLELGSTEDDLAAKYGQFPFVVSLEVIEHVFLPRIFAKRVYDLLVPGGIAIMSTPYHSYLKNVVLAITGKMDAHFTALWDYGHIKFWSRETLSYLLKEAGFKRVRFLRVGRVPILAKSMIAIAEK